MKVMTIDGERFRSVLLSADEWHNLINSIKKQLEEETFVAEFVTVLSERNDTPSFSNVGVVEDSLEARALVVHGDTQSGTIGWRPVLIPELPFDPKDMPDGSIVTGGSMYSTLPDNTESCIARPSIYKTVRHAHASIYRIGDTGEENQALNWLVWNGWLICTQVLLTNIPINDFRSAQLV